MSRIAIVGSRDFPDLDMVRRYVARLPQDTVIVSGGAPGPDTVAENMADKLFLSKSIHKADWTRNGRAAGPIRNALVIEDCEALVAFWDGVSPGTLDIIRKAVKSGKPVRIFGPMRKT
ncbi:MAG TPA: SLOG family protein [Polyangiaceae bacterium]|nr:SLOG family protein [Polyangiaceae bacterium]